MENGAREELLAEIAEADRVASMMADLDNSLRWTSFSSYRLRWASAQLAGADEFDPPDVSKLNEGELDTIWKIRFLSQLFASLQAKVPQFGDADFSGLASAIASDHSFVLNVPVGQRSKAGPLRSTMRFVKEWMKREGVTTTPAFVMALNDATRATAMVIGSDRFWRHTYAMAKCWGDAHCYADLARRILEEAWLCLAREEDAAFFASGTHGQTVGKLIASGTSNGWIPIATLRAWLSGPLRYDDGMVDDSFFGGTWWRDQLRTLRTGAGSASVEMKMTILRRLVNCPVRPDTPMVKELLKAMYVAGPIV